MIQHQTWLTTDAVKAFVGDGTIITDDRPFPEYFLLRRLRDGDKELRASPGYLLSLLPPSAETQPAP